MNTFFRQAFLFVAFALPALAQTRTVIVLPAGPPSDLVNRNATILNSDTLNIIGTVAVANDAYNAFTLPNGTKSYVIARGASNTVTVLNNAPSGVTVLKSLDLPAGSTDAYLTPDGRRLLVVSLNESFLTIIETSGDNVLLRVPLAAPANSVVSNFESGRAFTASPNGAVITAVDLTTNAAIGTITVPSEIAPLASGLGVAPNGFIYVSAVNRLFEIDPRTFQLNPGATIVMTGSPGRPQFTPDGSRALMNNFTPLAGNSAVILADLTTRTVQTAALPGLIVNPFRVVSNTLAYGFASAGQALFNINLSPLSITPVTTAGLPSPLTFRGFSGSNEAPQNRFFFVSSGNTVYKVDVATNLVTSFQTLTNASGIPVFQSLPSTAPVANIFAINQQQFVAISGTTSPLVIRAVDANGAPVAGAPVTYSTTANGVTFANPSIFTNSDGYAQTTATVPSFQTSVNLIATVAGTNTQVFTANVGFNVGGGGGAGGSGKILIFDGNGQIVFSQSPTPRPMRVRVVDANGNPVPTATVRWTITSGNGTLATTETLTDADGISSNQSFAASLVFGIQSAFSRVSIVASTSLGSITFTHIVIPRVLDGVSGPGREPIPAPRPNIFQLTPAQGTPEIRGASGATIKDAFRYRITSGFLQTSGIAGVALEAIAIPQEGSLETVAAQTARCDNSPVSGDDGLVSCDLVLGGRLGSAQLVVSVGAFQFYTFPLVVTQGAPRSMTVISGNNQSGSAGQALTRALVARLDDGVGTFLNGIPVTWTIQSGSATLFQTISTSGIGPIADPNNPANAITSPGLVSTNLRLGNSPGDVRVRVSVSPTIFADFTVTNTLALSTLIRVEGDTQTAPVATAFPSALVVEVKDTNGVVAPNVPVVFTSNGGVTLSASVVNTDANGRARVTASAGSTVGLFTITASSGTLTTAFTLNVTPLGPTITSIVNGASFLPGLSPCAVAQINGSNFATGVSGTLSGQSLVGPLVTSLSGISVSLGGVAAPLYSVSNIQGRETLSFQVPCEQAPGPVNLVLRSGSTSVNQNVTIAPYAPGIFTTLDGSGRPTIVAVKANGTYVSSTNPAELNEDIRVFVTGLGQASPFITTNTPGTGNQRVNGSVLIGLNNEGISARFEDTIYAPTLIGVYIVTFRMPASTATGTGRPFVIAVEGPDGSITYSQSAVLDVR